MNLPMTNLRLRIILALAILVASLTAVQMARAESTRFYNANGSFAGNAVHRGGSSSYYDGSGRFSGSSVRQGNTIRYYNHQGRFSGTTVKR